MPTTLDLQEPVRLAETVERLGLRYAVITSVDRDDLPDGGAFIFAQCIKSDSQAIAIVQGGGSDSGLPGQMRMRWRQSCTRRPDTLNHNIETVRRVFGTCETKGRL